jgi:hypothetical protein
MSYPGNSTERMLESLEELPDADISKIRTHEAGTDELDPSAIERPPHVCFVDGEHTDEACARDAEFCRRVMHDKGVVAFHDVWVVHGGINEFVESLRNSGFEYSLGYLPESVFVVEIGPRDLLADPALAGRQLENGAGVLWMLEAVGQYRAVLKGRRARVLRRLGLLQARDPGSD